jgi:hypothetical protein
MGSISVLDDDTVIRSRATTDNFKFHPNLD